MSNGKGENAKVQKQKVKLRYKLSQASRRSLRAEKRLATNCAMHFYFWTEVKVLVEKLIQENKTARLIRKYIKKKFGLVWS